MNKKEMYLKFIKDFNGIGITDILNDLNMNSSSFYTLEYSVENMQRVTNEMRKRIRKLYADVKDDEFILETKEKNVNFVKDIKDIQINRICRNLKIAKGSLYVYEASDSKYELVIDEIKKQIDEVFKKYHT